MDINNLHKASKRSYSDLSPSKLPYPYGLQSRKDGQLMPVRAEDGDPWRLCYAEDDVATGSNGTQRCWNPVEASLLNPSAQETSSPAHLPPDQEFIEPGSNRRFAEESLFNWPKAGDTSSLAHLSPDEGLMEPLPLELLDTPAKIWDNQKRVYSLERGDQLTAAPTAVNARVILNHMLDVMTGNMGKFERYSILFEEQGQEAISDCLARSLRAEALSVCEQGPWSRESLVTINGDLQHEGPAIYMHIIWCTDNPKKYYLYVGQSNNVAARLAQHRDPFYRVKFPSLHYHIFDPSTMSDSYVILAELSLADTKDIQLYLNLLEMWGSLLFQTLRSTDLSTWLPSGVDCPNAGQHLNIALPVHQFSSTEDGLERIQERERFRQLRHARDSLLRQHFWSVVNAWNDLRNSPDPKLRAYFLWKHTMDGCFPRVESARDLTFKAFVETKKVQKKAHGGFTINQISIRIPKPILRDMGPSFHVQLVLIDLDERHPECYAAQAIDTDPAKRLAIRIRYHDRLGNERGFWIRNHGPKCPMMVNSLVDKMESVPGRVIRNTPRRIFLLKKNVRRYTDE